METAWLVSGNEGYDPKLALLKWCYNGLIAEQNIEIPDGMTTDQKGAIFGTDSPYASNENAWFNYQNVVIKLSQI